MAHLHLVSITEQERRNDFQSGGAWSLKSEISSDKQGRRKGSRARGADRSKRAPTTLGQQIYPRNGGHPRHFLGNIVGYTSHSHINDCLFQSNIACF